MATDVLQPKAGAPADVAPLYHIENSEVERQGRAVPQCVCGGAALHRLQGAPRFLRRLERQVRPLCRLVSGLPGEPRPPGHPLLPEQPAPRRLPAALHAGWLAEGPRWRRPGPHRRPRRRDGRRLLPLHRLPTLHPRVSPGHRPRPHHPAGPLHPEHGRDRAEGAAGERARAARGRDPQHLEAAGAGAGGHPRVPGRGDGGEPRRQARVPPRPAGPGVRLLLRGERLHHGARHADGQRRGPLRGRGLGPLDDRHPQLRRHQLRPLLQRLAPRADHQAPRGRGEAAAGRNAPDRRVRARLALGLPVRPGLRRPGRAAGEELHRVHAGVPREGEDPPRPGTSSPRRSPTTTRATSPARAGSWSSRGRSSGPS